MRVIGLVSACFAGMLVLAGCTSGGACDCEFTASPEDMLKYAEVVVIAKPVGTEGLAYEAEDRGSPVAATAETGVFEVLEVLRGDIEATARIQVARLLEGVMEADRVFLVLAPTGLPRSTYGVPWGIQGNPGAASLDGDRPRFLVDEYHDDLLEERGLEPGPSRAGPAFDISEAELRRLAALPREEPTPPPTPTAEPARPNLYP